MPEDKIPDFQNPDWRKGFDTQSLVGWVVADKYKITRHIGGGGFGEVYEAINVNLPEQKVVIKFLKQIDSRDRFEKEAKILCQLSHPNICNIIDFLPKENALIMQFIEGRDCDQIIKESGPFKSDTALDIACKISDALAYAHSRGIAHRDIKPKNIMLDKQGHVYLIDFGIAKEVGVTGLTVTGQMALTPQFAAPERLNPDRPYDPFISDIYELGASVYRLITDLSPSEGLHSANKRASKDSINRNIPSLLRNILKKATQAAPDERYRTMKEFHQALINGGPKSSSTIPGWLKYAGVAAIIIIAAILLVNQFYSRNDKMLVNNGPFSKTVDSVNVKDDPDGDSTLAIPDKTNTVNKSKIEAKSQVSRQWIWKEPSPLEPTDNYSAGCVQEKATTECHIARDDQLNSQIARRRAYYKVIERGMGRLADSKAVSTQINDPASMMFDEYGGYVIDWDERAIGQKSIGHSISVKAGICPGPASGEQKSRAIGLLNRIFRGSPRVIIYLMSNEKDDFDMLSSFSGTFLECGYRVHEVEADASLEPIIEQALNMNKGKVSINDGQLPDCELVLPIRVEIGQARDSESKYLKGYKAVDITVAYRAIMPQTGQIMLAKTFSSTGIGPSVSSAENNAVSKAAEITVEDLVRGLPGMAMQKPVGLTIVCHEMDMGEIDNTMSLIAGYYGVLSVRKFSEEENKNRGSIEIGIDPTASSIDFIIEELRENLRYDYIIDKGASDEIVITKEKISY